MTFNDMNFVSRITLKLIKVKVPNLTEIFPTMSCSAPWFLDCLLLMIMELVPLITLNDMNIVLQISLKPLDVQPPNFTKILAALSCALWLCILDCLPIMMIIVISPDVLEGLIICGLFAFNC